MLGVMVGVRSVILALGIVLIATALDRMGGFWIGIVGGVLIGIFVATERG